MPSGFFGKIFIDIQKKKKMPIHKYFKSDTSKSNKEEEKAERRQKEDFTESQENEAEFLYSQAVDVNGLHLIPYVKDIESNNRNTNIKPGPCKNDTSNTSYSPSSSLDYDNNSPSLYKNFHPIYARYYVSIEEDSYKHPYSWSNLKRAVVVSLYALTSFGTQISTSMFGQSVTDISEEYNIGRTVAMLPTTLFMFGMALGPLVIAPVTEKYGRKTGILIPYSLASVFCTASFVIKPYWAVLLFRFLGGFLSSAPIISSGAALKDMFEPGRRADILLGYAVLAASGPTFGPIIGGAITQRIGSYRYIYLIAGGYMLITAGMSVLAIKESYRPLIEEQEASELEKAIHEHPQYSEVKLITKTTLNGKKLSLDRYLKTPYKLMATHLMFWLSLYACLGFGIMYMGAACMPTITKELFGWTTGTSSLFNISQFLGILVGTVINYFINSAYKKHTNRVKQEGSNVTWRPEMRFITMIVGGFLISAGFLIFWLTHRIGWYTVFIGQICIGAGFFPIFQAALNYVIDVHGDWSASAVSGITLLRSIAAGIVPLLSIQLLESLGNSKLFMIMFTVSMIANSLPIIMYFKWGKVRVRGRYSLDFPQ